MVKKATRAPRLGLGANLGQFTLLVGVNGLVGALVGQERALVPLLGEQVFGVRSATAGLAFVATFGAAKALANLVAGVLADRIGRRPVLVAGWLVALPVPVVLMLAPGWEWVVAANLLLGLNQGLCWSTTVVMKIDLAGPDRRGLAMGLNESSGYLAVAGSAWISGLLAARYGLRPEPFFLGLAVAGLGLGLSLLAVRETKAHSLLEAGGAAAMPFRRVLSLGSRGHRGLAAVSRTGLVNNANDALAWGLFPLLMAEEGFDGARIGAVAAIYPAVWGLGQLVTGALADRIGRRIPIVFGMCVQAAALVWFGLGGGFAARALAAAALGMGTAFTYPSLLAAVGDMAGASWRAGAVGVYRLWRDSGYVVGALGAGIAADLLGMKGAIGLVAVLTALSGLDAWRHLAPDSSSVTLKSGTWT